MGPGRILENIKDAVTGGNHSESAESVNPRDADRGILPASQDPLGDPADNRAYDSAYDNAEILPASQDPLGDPADQQA